MPHKFLSAATPGASAHKPRKRGLFPAGESAAGAGNGAADTAFFSSSLELPFLWPHKKISARQAVVPVFLPFRGCPVRCVFCAQDVQTGHAMSSMPVTGGQCSSASGIDAVLATARETLRRCAVKARASAESVELAFYGGTFTAMPERDMARCLDFAREAREQGWIGEFRCSTRPDSITPFVLERLREAGCATVELGVQSFANGALAASRRGYDGMVAQNACAMVRGAGLRLGVQLLPGMPGHAPEDFMLDVQLAVDAGADMLRFYPCLVLEGTELAALWRAEKYAPWTLPVTLAALAEGWLAAATASVPVIRMGLAPEPGLNKAILAGPVDSALGSRVMARALLLAARRELENRGTARPPAFDICLPRIVQGCLWGDRSELRKEWLALGLRNVIWSDNARPVLRYAALA